MTDMLDQLRSIPLLHQQLDPADRLPGDGRRPTPGSRPPLRLDILHLTDTRRMLGWDDIDPTYDDPVNKERFGILPLLELWTAAIRAEMSRNGLDDWPDPADTTTVQTETDWLLDTHDWWRHQDWAGVLERDIQATWRQLKAALGERPEPRYVCPHCGDRMTLNSSSEWLFCDSGHEERVGDLEQRIRRRPAQLAADLAEEFHIDPGLIRQWRARGRLEPARVESQRRVFYLPWDVFCLVNPDIAAAIEQRDTAA